MDFLTRLVLAIAEARARMGGGKRLAKKKRPKVSIRPAKMGPSVGCGTGAGGFKAGNNCQKEDGIPQRPLSHGGALKGANAKADLAKAKAMEDAAKAKQAKKEADAKAQSIATKPQRDKQKQINKLRAEAAKRKAEKGERDAAAKQAAMEAAAKKRAAMLQIIRLKKANAKLEVVGTPKSLKEEIAEMKLKQASKSLKVVGTPKSIKDEIDALKASGKFKSAPPPAPTKSLGDGLAVKHADASQSEIDKDRAVVFGKHNEAGWGHNAPQGWTEKEKVSKRVKHEIATDLANRIAKSGIKESDISDEMLDYFDHYHSFYGTTAAIAKLNAAGVQPSMHRRYAFAAGVVHQWAESSGDSSPNSVGVQYAIRTELKVKGATTKHFGSDSANQEEWKKQYADRIKKIQKNKAVRALVRAQYEATQEHFKKIGVTHLTLVRGWSGSEKVKAGQDQSLTLQPASSFSMSKGVSYGFAGGVAEKMRGVVAKVPVSRVFSTCVTGFGCLGEQEIVVLGGKLSGKVTKLPGSPSQW